MAEALSKSNAKVLVHCHQGISRSASVIIYYVMKQYHELFYDALLFVKEKKPNINPNPNFGSQLIRYNKIIRELNEIL